MFDPVEALKKFVRFPSVSTDESCAEGMRGAVEFLESLLKDAGFSVEIVPTALHPIILARREGPKEWPHVVIYGHYDVQPADPLNLWTTSPFDPVERNGRLYGRGAADNKGPLLAHISAITGLLEENPDLPLRITFLIEGEEEIGSPSFAAFLKSHRSAFADADFVFLSDTGMPRPDQVVVTTGLRGLVTIEVEVAGPKRDLHSGVHGGAIRNPIQALTGLCASLHDETGRVAVAGFYDDVVEVADWERKELARLGSSEEEYRGFLGVKGFHVPNGLSPFEAVRFYPTLEFNGIGGGYQGEGSKTVIPSKAWVKISCRLVANQDPDRIRDLVHAHLETHCPDDVRMKIEDGHGGHPYLVVPPGRPNTPPDQSPVLAAAFRAAEAHIGRIFGNPPLFLREGGSVPIIADIKRVLGLDSLMMGLFLPEDNLHAPDESFHLGVMKNAIKASREILRSVAEGRPPRFALL